MKRFIVTNLLAVAALPMLACMWVGTHNWYLFHAYDDQKSEFAQRVDMITCNNWKAYLGLAEDAPFWFDSQRIAEAAEAKGDDLMAGYVTHLQQYVDICSDMNRDAWDYPTKEELSARREAIAALRLYASAKLKTRLRSQHALLFMRCNMLLGRHAENVTFWEQTACRYIETVYKDMMKNIYAGALCHTGRDVEAGRIFAEQGDWSSLMTQYYQLRSFKAIQHEYARDPNSAVLPFLLQDFVNNAQEAVDAKDAPEDALPGKLFVRDIERAEAMQMIGLAERAVADKAVQEPMLWQAAKAWLRYLFGDMRQAAADIDAAMLMEGSDMLKSNARVLRFYIHAATKPLSTTYDNFGAQELEWMFAPADSASADTQASDAATSIVGTRYYYAVDRTVNQVLADKLFSAGRTEQALALLCAAQANDYHSRLYAMGVDSIKAYLSYLQQPPQSRLDIFLKAHARADEDELRDLIGTKYLNMYKWDEAIAWLQDVPTDYYARQPIAPYAALRKWDVEPWVTRQWLRDSQIWGDERPELTFNVKLAFAREMRAMTSGLSLLNGEARRQRCYDLAVRFAQVDGSGDLWFIMNESKTIDLYETLIDGERRPGDCAGKAVSLLEEAAKSSDFNLRERALFALAYIYLNPDSWKKTEWDSDIRDDRWIPQPDTRQYRAFAALADFERRHGGKPSAFVSNCDEYKRFVKHYK